MSIYQTDEWKEAMIAGGYKPVDIFGSDKVVAFENTVKAFFGKRKIIVARGISNHEHLRAFLNISKKYFYGTIAAKVTDYNDDIFKKIGFRRVDDYTILIDLSKTEEELWHNLEKKSARWGAKTAEKNTLVFEEIKDVLDLKDFYSLYKDTAASGGFSGKNFEF